MIDDLERTNFLLEKLKTVVPIEARLPQSLIRLLAEKSPEMPIPERCNVIDVFYTGDEGGIICCLDIAGPFSSPICDGRFGIPAGGNV